MPTAPEFPDSAAAAALALSISRGEPAAENALAALFRPTVRAYLRTRLHDAGSAEDLADDVLMAALLALRRGLVRDPSRIGPFIHGIALRASRNHLRRLRRRLPLLPLERDVEDPAACDEFRRLDDRDTVLQALDTLGETDRAILRLLLEEGMRESEVAVRLCLKVATVRQRKRRCLRRLRGFLEDS